MAFSGFDRSRKTTALLPALGAICAGLVATAAVTGSTAVNAQDTLAPLTFTEEQVSRGASIYDGSCASCHAENLAGLDGPGLKGPTFEHWFAGSVGALFDFLSVAMPLDDPGGLSATQYVNLIAFIASENGYVAGEVPLPGTTEELALIGFTQP
jgi:cytochrome c